MSTATTAASRLADEFLGLAGTEINPRHWGLRRQIGRLLQRAHHEGLLNSQPGLASAIKWQMDNPPPLRTPNKGGHVRLAREIGRPWDGSMYTPAQAQQAELHDALCKAAVDSTGLSGAELCRWIAELLSENPKIKGGRPVATADRKRRVRELYAQGWKRARIAEELGITPQQVSDANR